MERISHLQYVLGAIQKLRMLYRRGGSLTKAYAKDRGRGSVVNGSLLIPRESLLPTYVCVGSNKYLFTCFVVSFHVMQISFKYLFLFTDRVSNDTIYEGNERYEGYSVDLIDNIAKLIGFSYKIEIVADNKQGSYDKTTKKWNGLVKYLLDRVGDTNFMLLLQMKKPFELRTDREALWQIIDSSSAVFHKNASCPISHFFCVFSFVNDMNFNFSSLFEQRKLIWQFVTSLLRMTDVLKWILQCLL